MEKNRPSSGEGSGGQLPEVLADNIQLLLEQHQKELDRESKVEMAVRRIATFVGSVEFIYLHLLIYGSWLFLASGLSSLPRIDPHLAEMAVCVGLESLFLSACILFNQNRNQKIANEREQLHLNISLLAEREATRVMQMVPAIAQQHGVPEVGGRDLKELMEDIQPEAVLDEIKRKNPDDEGGSE